MRLLLVDDQVLFLEGLRHLLAAYDVEVVGTARDGLEAMAKARELHPDVILMDIHMPGCGGLEAVRLIKAEMPTIKIVMLTVSAEDRDLFEAIKSGASGYLLKNLDGDELISFLSGLTRGEAPLSAGLAARVFRELARQSSGGEPASQVAGAEPPEAVAGQPEDLTPRQTAILALVAQGLTYKEIGARLYLTERTVKYHMDRILERLHLEHRAEAITYAQRKGLIAGKKPDPD